MLLCMYTTYAPDVQWSQKKTYDPVQPDLQIIKILLVVTALNLGPLQKQSVFLTA